MMFNPSSSSLLLLLLAGLCLGPASAVPTCSQIADMSHWLNKTMQAPHPTSSSNLRPLALRLGFHSCVGGCNGCVNFNNPDNAGLEVAVDNFTTLYYAKGYNHIVSLADFYALAAVVSITTAVHDSNVERTGTTDSPCPIPCFSMQWGRTDVQDCSEDDSELPIPTMTGDAMFDYFKREFGFSRDQVVALMGAHSLGAAFPENSGYQGKWTGNQNHGLSEIFYSHMINPHIEFTNVDLSNDTVPRYQFKAKYTNHTNAGIMFNTDFELFYNLTLDEDAKLTCTLNHVCGLEDSCENFCAKATTFETAHNYAQDCPAFMTDFEDVITLMLRNGYADSDLETTDCPCS